MAGALLEDLALSELLARRESVTPRVEIGPRRTHAGDEVDFVIERGRAALPIEIKMNSRVTSSDAKGLHRFLQEYPKIDPWGLLLHRGEEVSQLSDRIVAAPLDT
jgi:predicted AAA+ superfamily ATPase